MNNKFVVEIPHNLKLINSKLWLGLTKRQLIGFIVTGIVFSLFFFPLYKFSTDFAVYTAFIFASPCMFITIFHKNGLYAEVWIKLYLKKHFLNKNPRQYKLKKDNIKIATERGMVKRVKKRKPISST